MEWKHRDIVVQEGLRPGEPDGRNIQYFFLGLKDDKKVFKYCVWLDRGSKIAGGLGAEEQRIIEYMRARGKDRVVEKIDGRDFEDVCLLVSDTEEKEVALEGLDEKLT